MFTYHPQFQALEHYPGGMPMPGRCYPDPATNTKPYRFGMNGQEKDDEIAGNGNIYSALYWEYDSRSLRRWNLDPKPTVGISDYSCFGGNPIFNADPNGDFFFGLYGSTSSERRESRAQKFADANGGYVMHGAGGKPYVVYDFNKVKDQVNQGTDASFGVVQTEKYEDKFGDFSSFKNFFNTLRRMDDEAVGGHDGANTGKVDKQDAAVAGGIISIMTGTGAILEGGAILGGAISIGIGVDDCGTNSKGESLIEGILPNDATKAGWTGIKSIASGVNAYTSTKEMAKEGIKAFTAIGTALDATGTIENANKTKEHIESAVDKSKKVK